MDEDGKSGEMDTKTPGGTSLYSVRCSLLGIETTLARLYLCASPIFFSQGLLGLQPDENVDDAGASGRDGERQDSNANEFKKNNRAGGPSLMLVNVLAWLRLPPRSR